ncbi:MAG: type II secretion system secretin GspD [Hyphomicrobium aestuarii]|nr:type II secretion system secretin GspD [Hyphomicrobium aestuarii]
MFRLAIAALTLTVAGCAGPDTGRFREPLTDWQMRNIGGQHELAASVDETGGIGGRVGVHNGNSEQTVYPGAGSLAAPHPGVTYASSGNVTVSFDGVDAKEAAKVILDDVLQTTYAIDPRVEGKITIKSGKPVPPRDALRLLETGLQQAGAILVIRNGTHHVVPKGQALPDGPNAIVPASRGSVAGFMTRAVQLRHIAAAEMSEILKPIMSKDGMVRVDQARNVVVLAGSSADHDAWMETIRTFDVDWLSNRSVAVFKITSMPIEAMVKSLTEVLRNENIGEQLVKFVPIEAGNSLLAVAKTPEALQTARGWVKRLEAAGGQRLQLFNYQMRYAQASQVAPILGKVFGVATASEGEVAALTSRPGGSAQARGNGAASANRPASGGANVTPAGQGLNGNGNGNGAGLLAPSAASPGAMPGGVVAASGARTQLASGGLGGGGGSEGGLPTSMRIIANEPTNTLLIYATEDEFEKVKNVLRTLDVPPKQVLVEATIVEVGLNEDLRYGVQYYLQGSIKGLPIQVALTNGNFNGVGPSAPGFGLTLDAPAKAVIDALNDVTQVNVVSAPNVMVLNNQSARLVVGDQVPIATQSSSDPLQGNQVIVNTIELRDTGVIFEVTPRINSSGSVQLDIVQEVSSVKRQADPTLTPTISQRKLSSSVTVENGETIVLGGLFSTQGNVGRAGLPILSELPVIGGAFGRTTDATARTELIVLISPKIVGDKFQARAATNEMRRRIQELRFEDANVYEKDLAPPDVVVEKPVPATPLLPVERSNCEQPCSVIPLTPAPVSGAPHAPQGPSFKDSERLTTSSIGRAQPQAATASKSAKPAVSANMPKSPAVEKTPVVEKPAAAAAKPTASASRPGGTRPSAIGELRTGVY